VPSRPVSEIKQMGLGEGVGGAFGGLVYAGRECGCVGVCVCVCVGERGKKREIMRARHHLCEKKTRALSSFFLAPSNYRPLLQNIVSLIGLFCTRIYICICIQKRRENASREGERRGDKLSLQSRLQQQLHIQVQVQWQWQCGGGCKCSCRFSGSCDSCSGKV